MLKFAFKILVSIRAKLIFVLIMVGFLLVGIASYSINNIENTGHTALNTYQGAAQSNQYLDSAKITLARIETVLFQDTLARQNGVASNLKPIRANLAALEADMQRLENSVRNEKAQYHIAQTQKFINIWQAQIASHKAESNPPLIVYFENNFQSVYEHLHSLTDLQSQAMRAERIATENNIRDTITNITWCVLAGMALVVLLTMWMGVTILNPLKMSTDVAKKISDGDYNTAIPQGRKDEMGQLFQSMSVLQNNIRKLIARERNEKDQAKDNLDAALRNSQDAILITNADGKIAIANDQVKTFFPTVIDENFIGGELARYFNYAGHPVNGAAEIFPETHEMRLESGCWTKISASDMEEGGRLLIWNDITQLKQREANLHIAKNKAESADKAKTLFLASMSHELRTPLNAIIGFSDLMDQELVGPMSNPEHRELNRHILENGEALLCMIEDVLVVAGARNETRETLDFDTAALTDLIDNALKTISEECTQRGIRVIWNKPETRYNIDCNVPRLTRVFEALLSNAARFNKDNGRIKIALTPSPKTSHPNGVFIDVTDTGIGIAQADLAKVMTPFAQVDASYNRAHDGAGLGLALAQHWAGLHDGKLQLASKLGKGTMVRIFLPVMAQDALQIDMENTPNNNMVELGVHEKAADKLAEKAASKVEQPLHKTA